MNKTFKVAQVRDLLNQVNNEQITFSRFVEILNEAQKEAYNQALEDAAENAACEYEKDYLTGEIDKQSILKLKK